MPKNDNFYPNWSETATRGDLIRAIVFLRSEVTALAGAITAMRLQNENDLQDRMSAFFKASKDTDGVMDEISGGIGDGKQSN
jgi:hypothetical protein